MCVCSAGDFLAIGKCLLSITCQITVLGAYNKHLYRIQLLLFSFYIFSLNEEEEEEREVWQGMSENTTATFLDAADESFGLEDA